MLEERYLLILEKMEDFVATWRSERIFLCL